MPPKAKAKAKAKTRHVLAIDKYAQAPRDMQAVARSLDDSDLVKRTQKALGERHARDDRIDCMPAGGEEVKTLAKKVEGMKEQLKGMGSTVRSHSPRSSRHVAFLCSSRAVDPRRCPGRWIASELQVWIHLQGWRRNVRCSVMPERHQLA